MGFTQFGKMLSHSYDCLNRQGALRRLSDAAFEQARGARTEYRHRVSTDITQRSSGLANSVEAKACIDELRAGGH